MSTWQLKLKYTLNYDLPDKLREVVLKFNEQNAFDEMILAPKRNNRK